MVLMLIPVVLVSLFALVLVTRERPMAIDTYTSAPRVSSLDPALDVVRERFTRGELRREEYDRLVLDLLLR